MKRLLIPTLLGAVAMLSPSLPAFAQSGLAAAIAAGQVGEQADGYVGIAKSVPPAVKAEVEALNIKRRAAYTDQAAKHGVTLREWAATVGCQTLRRVGQGEAYLLPDGVWRTKGAEPVALPAICG